MTPDESFLATFFGEGNEIPWYSSGKEPGPKVDKVRPWVQRYLAGHRPAPLPRVRTVDGIYKTTWYVIVDDRDSAALTRAEIQGFLGPSYTDWDPLVDRLDPGDAIDDLVAGRHPHVLKVTITGWRSGKAYRARADTVRERLEMWLQVRARQPANVREEAELLADLIYRFEDALRLGRLELAEDHLRMMEHAGGLSTTNLSGLEFLLLEAHNAWDDIWRKGSYDRLIEAGPPRRVSQAMLRAAYNAKVVRYQRAGDAAGALRVYTAEVAPRCSPLLGSAKGLVAGEALTLRLLRELTRSDPAWARIESTQADALRAHVDEAWIEALIQAADIVSPEVGSEDLDVFERVGREFGLNNLDVAWSVAWASDASPRRSTWLLRLADEADSVTWAHEALESVADLGSLSADAFLVRLRDRVRRRFVPESGAEAEDGVPSGWMDWARCLGRSKRFTAGVSLAEEGRIEWRIEEAADPDWREFAGVLGGVSEANEPILRRSVPHILSALGDSPAGLEGLGEVYGQLLDVVLVDRAPGDTFFPTLGDLLDRRLSFGTDTVTYDRILGDIYGCAGQWIAPVTIPDVLDLVDLLFFRVCPAVEVRLAFVTKVLGACLGHMGRLSPPILALLSELVRSVGWAEDPFDARLKELADADPSEAITAADVLDGLTLALYSLDQSALRRAKAAIKRLNPTVTVKLYSDKVASDSLLAAAKNAALFVVTHKSAKHSATEAIEAVRTGPLRYAQGKGSSSIVRAVWEWAESQVAVTV